MKKLFFYFFLILVCLSLFSVQSNFADKKSLQVNSPQNLSDGWVMKLAPDTENFVNVFFKTENLGCIYTGHHPVKRTVDGGSNWGYGIIPTLTGTNGGIYFNGNEIFMTGYQFTSPYYYGYVFKSSNMGVNWNIVYNIQFPVIGLIGNIDLISMYKNIGYLTIDQVAFPQWRRTNNGGNSWYIVSLNLPPSGTFAVSSSLSYIDTNVIYGVDYSGTIGRYTAGPNYGFFTVIKYGTASKICVVDSSNIVALSGSKIIKSTNAGATWDSTQFPVRLNSISFPDQNTGYMTGSNGKIYKSTNKGANWISQYTPTTDSLVDCCFLNTLTGYVIGYNGTLLKTTDGGSSPVFTISGTVLYSDNNQPVTSGKVKAFKFDRNTWNVVYLDSANIQSDGTYTLTNVPQDSIDIGVFPNSTPPNDWVITYYPSTIYWEKATTLYPTGNLTNIDIGAIRMSASTNNNSVKGRITGVADSYASNLKDAFMYAKNGNTFVRCSVSDANGRYDLQSLPTGNLKIIATRLGFSRDSITVSVTQTSNIDSINFQLHRITVGIKKISSTVSNEYKLFQNYPNPFNPVTIIRYSIPPDVKGETSNVKLILYDILGKEVEVLVNERQEPGVYEVAWDASRFPSGIYLYRLQVENANRTEFYYNATKKMVFLK